jgi:UDP-3-O-[3-hydroxymyristoyl] glucosamine N-acyltransferase
MHLARFNIPISKNELIDLFDEVNQSYQFFCDEDFSVVGPSSLDFSEPNTISFYQDNSGFISDDRVLVIVNQEIFPANGNLVFVKDPKHFFIKFITLCEERLMFKDSYTKLIENNAFDFCDIHPTAVIEEGVSIGRNSIISAGCVLKKGTHVGANCIVRENTIIGVDGISPYKSISGKLLKFPHVAGVIIYDNVEIGANCVISKGTLQYTEIGNGSIIGNLCNVGHSCNIGEKVWMSVGTLLGGYTKINSYATLGMGVTLKHGICIGDDSSVGMGSVVVKSLGDKKSCFGNPAKTIRSIKVGPKR